MPRSRHRGGLDRRVVLLEDGPAGREIRRAHERQQHGAGVHAPLRELVRGDRRRAGRGRRSPPLRRRPQPLVDDRIRGEGARPGCARARGRPRGPAVDDRDIAVVGHPPDHRGRQPPAFADRGDVGESLRPDDREHPLLALADHDLERLHARLAPRDRVEVDADAGAGPVGGLGRGAGDAGGAEVLQPLDEAALDELERRLDEQLLGKRVANLHGRALRRIVVGEGCGGEDRRSPDAVAAGRAAEQHGKVPGPGRGRAGEVALLEQPDGHHVDERVVRVRRVEDQLAADRRHADAVAVAADAADDAVDEVSRSRLGRVAEAQRIEHGDRASAHREDVAEDPADACRGALVRLDGASGGCATRA